MLDDHGIEFGKYRDYRSFRIQDVQKSMLVDIRSCTSNEINPIAAITCYFQLHICINSLAHLNSPRHVFVCAKSWRCLSVLLRCGVCSLTRKPGYSASVKRFCQASRRFVSASTQVGKQNGKVGSCLASAGNLGSAGASTGKEVGDLLLQAASPTISDINSSLDALVLSLGIIGCSVDVVGDLAL